MSAGWTALYEAIEETRALLSAEAPDATTQAEGEAYIARVAAAGLGSALLGHLFQEGGLSRALPVYGGPNPDYIMRHAGVDPAHKYRLEGRLNGSERVGIGVYTLGRNGAPLIAGYTAFDRGNCPQDGNFHLDIATDATGPNSLALPPEARILLVRILHRDNSEPARLALAGSGNVQRPGLKAGSHDETLSFVANGLRNTVREYLKWMAAARNLPNRLDVAPPDLTETVQGDADTQYFLGGFDLAEDEWLEVVLPASLTGYWSLHAYNFWYEHLQTTGVHDRNATPDADGCIRIAVGPTLPTDARNRIDTAGRRKGAFVLRIVGQDNAIERPMTSLYRL